VRPWAFAARPSLRYEVLDSPVGVVARVTFLLNAFDVNRFPSIRHRRAIIIIYEGYQAPVGAVIDLIMGAMPTSC
jgi:hypothetical protein